MNERELNVHTTRTSTRLPTRYCYYYCLLLFNRSIFQILLQVRLERVPVMLILVLASLVLVLVLVGLVLVLVLKESLRTKFKSLSLSWSL